MSGILNARPDPALPECRESFTSDLTGSHHDKALKAQCKIPAIEKSRIWTFYKPLPTEKRKFQLENQPKNQGKSTLRSNVTTVSV